MTPLTIRTLIEGAEKLGPVTARKIRGPYTGGLFTSSSPVPFALFEETWQAEAVAELLQLLQRWGEWRKQALEVARAALMSMRGQDREELARRAEELPCG